MYESFVSCIEKQTLNEKKETKQNKTKQKSQMNNNSVNKSATSVSAINKFSFLFQNSKLPTKFVVILCFNQLNYSVNFVSETNVGFFYSLRNIKRKKVRDTEKREENNE